MKYVYKSFIVLFAFFVMIHLASCNYDNEIQDPMSATNDPSGCEAPSVVTHAVTPTKAGSTITFRGLSRVSMPSGHEDDLTYHRLTIYLYRDGLLADIEYVGGEGASWKLNAVGTSWDSGTQYYTVAHTLYKYLCDGDLITGEKWDTSDTATL